MNLKNIFLILRKKRLGIWMEFIVQIAEREIGICYIIPSQEQKTFIPISWKKKKKI